MKAPHHKLYDRTKERLTLDEIGLCMSSAVATLVSCLRVASIGPGSRNTNKPPRRWNVRPPR
jgi:hypothetical protein